METVRSGLFVSVDYKGTLGNGEVFDSSHGRTPLEVEIGADQLIKGFENALLGMSLNEKKTFTLVPEEAYGLRDDNQKRSFSLSEIPPDMNPEVGQTIALSTPDGQQMPATITEVTKEQVTIDMNHPLAGESLTFEIEIVGISSEPTQAHGGCGCGCDTEPSHASGGCGCEGGCGSSSCGCD
ncbi:MAG: peptidylprolyl isomerase [Pseudomonadota bacterium]